MKQILIVVVRYKIPLEESQAIRSLVSVLGAHPGLLESAGLLIWDNSPERLDNPQLPFPFESKHTGQNLGVSGAYNLAMEFAESTNYTWLLLLDQDTILPDGFLAKMLEYSFRVQNNTRVAAVAPTIYVGASCVSPKLTTIGHAKDFPPGFIGISPREVILVNTGTLLRVTALREIGGFSTEFWLDFSDRYLCHMLQSHSKSVWIAGDLRLEHRISLLDHAMSEERYSNFVAAQDAYFSLYRSYIRNVIYTLKLLRQAIHKRRIEGNQLHSKVLMGYFLRRIFLSKAKRLDRWRQQNLKREIPVISHGKVIG